MIFFTTVVMPLILTNNVAMSLIKLINEYSINKIWLRVILGALSFLGVLATSAFTGDPINFDSLSSIGSALFDVLVVALGSHFTYKMIKS